MTRREGPETKAPVLSVCIPAYNGAAYLAEAMQSVLDQTFSDFELIVVDDASTDATVEIARSFQDPRLRHQGNRVNRGLVGNWNRCLELARGAYVCLFHQDDVMMPDNLAAKVGFLERSPTAGFVHSNVLQVGPQGELLSAWWSPKPAPEDVGLQPGTVVLDQLLSDGNAVCAPSVVLRRECLDAVGPFDGRLPYTADWEMWMRASVFFDVGYFVEPLVKYRRHGHNETLKFQEAEQEHAYRAKRLVLEKCGAYIPGAEHLKARLAHQYRELAEGPATFSGETGDALEAGRSRRAAQRVGGDEAGSPGPGEEARLQAARAELDQARAELGLARGRIAAMESTKFWKLRGAWFRLKRALRLPVDT